MFSNPKNPPQKLDVPALADVSPQYKALVARKAELDDRLRELEIRLREETRQATSPRRDFQNKVQLLVDPNQPIAESSTGLSDDKPVIMSRVQAIADEIQATKTALEQLNGLISDERMRASAVICVKMAPEHKRRVRAILSAMASLVDACGDYRVFMDSMNGENIAWSTLRPMLPFWVADRAGLYFREAVEYGFATTDELPKIREDLRR